jgi:hypothetical protein
MIILVQFGSSAKQVPFKKRPAYFVGWKSNALIGRVHMDLSLVATDEDELTAFHVPDLIPGFTHRKIGAKSTRG